MVLLSTLILLFISAFSNANNSYQELTDVFFDNLRALPLLLEETKLTDSSKEFIQKQIENYRNLNFDTTRLKKRSATYIGESIQHGVEKISFEPIFNINSTDPIHTVFVKHEDNVYAVVLDNNGEQLSIFIYKNETFTRIKNSNVHKGVKVAAYPLKNSLLIVVAEFRDFSSDVEDGIKVFEWNLQRQLKIRHFVDVPFATDVKIWDYQGDIFMSIASYKNSQNKYETKTPIYKWVDRYFDLIQEVETSGAKSLSPFTIDNFQYLAVSNSKRNSGNTQTYSEIFKFDVQTNTFLPYQRILTRGCHHLKYFKINEYNEHFLAVANNHKQGINGEFVLETNSVVYKLVDDYFIPFQTLSTNGIIQWETTEMDNKVLILLALNLDENGQSSISAYSYNGWKFVKPKNDIPSSLFSQNLQTITAYNLANATILACSGNNVPHNIFKLEVATNKDLKEEYDEMLKWCQSEITRIKSKEKLHVSKRQTDQLSENTHFAQIEFIQNTLDAYKLEMGEVHKKINSSYQLQGTHTIQQDVTTKNVLVTNNLKINDMTTKIINERDMNNFKETVVRIDENIFMEEVKFDSITISSSIDTKRVNNHDVEELVYSHDDIHLNKLNVNGLAHFKQSLNVGSLNNIIISKSNILVNGENQTFADFQHDSLVLDNIRTKNLNKLDMETTFKRNNTLISKLDTLRAKKVVIGGFINDIDITTLYKYALRKSGLQEIHMPYFFDSVQANDFSIRGLLTEKDLSNLVSIAKGDHNLSRDLLFASDLHVNNLHVKKFLDKIEIKKGKLDLLLKNTSESQHITAPKVFDNVNILNLIKLRGNVRNKELLDKNTLAVTNSPVIVDSDVTLTGEVIIESLLHCKDLVSSNKASLQHLEQQGLKLDEAEIPVHLKFISPLNIEHIFVDNINKVNPATSWVVAGEQTQVISGWKQFLGNVVVTGGTDVEKINNILVSELEGNILMKTGDQEISGKHVIKYLVTEHDINYKNITFGANKWEDVLTLEDDQEVEGITTFKNTLKANKGVVTTLQVNGKMNDHDFDELVRDTVMKNSDKIITGHKTISTLNVENIKLRNSEAMDGIFTMENEIDNFTINHDINIESELSVNNINFYKQINGVPKEEFGIQKVDGVEYLVNETQEFDSITVYSKAYIESKKINDVDLEYLIEESVKRDEFHEFENANFVNKSSVIVNETLELDGHIENLDLENVIDFNSSEIQVLHDKKSFPGLLVHGNVYFDGLVNNKSFETLCTMVSAKHPINLKIKGNAYFAKGPHVRKINEHIVEDLKANAWFKDVPTNITENVLFNNVSFKDDVVLKGLLNGEKLENLSSNYFSKSQNQTITSTLSFTNDVVFENLVTAQLNTTGFINDIKLEDFLQTVILNNTDQIFESPVYFENFTANKINGEYLINELDLENGVMRYDVENIVTGRKTFGNLSTINLFMKDNIEVQDVAISKWMKNVLLNEGDYVVKGHYKFNAPPTFEKGLSMEGLLNNINFTRENIMLRNVHQTITGTKTFNSGTVHFKSVQIDHGTINDVDFSKLFSNQVFKNKDSVIKTPVNFFNNMTVDNLNLFGNFNGVNITKLMANLTELHALNNFDENFVRMKRMTEEIQFSMQNQAYFLEYLKMIQYFMNVTHVLGVTDDEHIGKLVTLANNSHAVTLNIFLWDNEAEFFMFEDSLTILFGSYPTFVQNLRFGRKDIIYMERREAHSDTSHIGEIACLTSNNTLQIKYQLFSNGSHFVTSIYLTARASPCLAFIDSMKNQVFMLCEISGDLVNLSALRYPSVHGMTFLNIEKHTYLAVISTGTEEKAPCTEIFKFNNETSLFESKQIIFEDILRSISSVSYNDQHYIAVVSGHLQNTMVFGGVTIRRFNRETGQFDKMQVIELDAPLQVEFTVLPSNELVLYILTENPTAPFVVYMYNGISGFTEAIVGSTVPQTLFMNTFTLNNDIFIAAYHDDRINIMKGIFKGNKFL